MKRLVIVDAFDLLHRAYHALPTTLKNKKGELINAVYGFTSILLSLIDELKPDFLIVATELKGPTFREAEFAAYKATRVTDEEKEKEFLVQVPKVEKILSAFGIPYLYAQGFEADDVIGTLVNQTTKQPLEVVVVSNDQDLLQLVSPGVRVYLPKKGKKSTQIFDEKKVKEVYGFSPSQMVDFKALRGDPSDNIPGVFGIGEKTAVALLKEFGTVENVYANLGKVSPRVAKKLAEGAEPAVLSKKLATIVTSAPVKLDWESCRFREVNKKKGIKVLKEFGFKSLVKRLEKKEDRGEGKEKSGQLAFL